MNVLMTGASSGIGLECVKMISHDFPNSIFALVGRNLEDLSKLVDSQHLVDSKIYNYDLKDSLNIESLVCSILEDFTSIDALVYCAGMSLESKLRKIKPSLARDMMSVNYLSFLEMVRQLTLKKDKNLPLKIVVISSLAVTGPFVFESIYSSTKAAIEASVRSLSPELSDINTTINCVRPALVDTPMNAGIKLAHGDDFDNYVKDTLHQRLGIISPKTVANAVSFLLSDKSLGISGDVISISSAFSMT